MPKVAIPSSNFFADAVMDTAPAPAAPAVPEKAAPAPEPPPAAAAAPEKTAPEPLSSAPVPEKKDGEIENPHVRLTLQPEQTKPIKDEVTDLEEKILRRLTEKEQLAWRDERKRNQLLKEASEAAEKRASELEEKSKTLEQQLRELEAVRERAQKLDQEREQLDREFSVHQVEQSRRWKKEVETPRKQVQETVERLAKKYEIDPQELLKALAPKTGDEDDTFDQIVSDFSTRDKIEASKLIDTLGAAEKLAEELKNNSKTELQKLQAEEKARQEQEDIEYQADFERSAKHSFQVLQARNKFLKPVEGHDDWNNRLALLEREASGLNINQLPVEHVGEMSVAWKVLPVLERSYETVIAKMDAHIKQQQEAISKLERRLNGERAATPGAGSGGGSETVASNGNGRPAATTRPGNAFVDSLPY